MKLLFFFALVGVAVADDSYIIGGDTVTEAGEYPWQGSLRYFGSHICGVSLISSTWGLTASHCVDTAIVSLVIARFGSIQHATGGVTTNIKQIIMHEDYDEGAGHMANNIAVLNFESTVSGAFIKVIDMANAGEEHAGNDDCWITGWGYTKVGGGYIPNDLQEASVNVYTNTECKKTWGNDVSSGMVCVGDKKLGHGSCSGDSGGPLACKVSGSWVLVGVDSWGFYNCDTSYPSVYTRVASYRSWVKEKTGI